ncbi:hypothetical protein LCGC14_0543900 [marine sediment metagenome]|uniref:Uncharacterized protein n=1 Tax=marine sediment metagenome TaxID=412755 RepID=A0A0F9UDJ8_9ZZZZ
MEESKLLKVASYRQEVVSQFLEYVHRFPENEKWFTEEFDELAWNNKFVGQFRNHISLTAVPLATKIYKQLEIITFPFIHRVACRGWDTAGGTWAWSMNCVTQGQYIGDIGSTDPVQYLLKKSINLYKLDSGEIGGQ